MARRRRLLGLASTGLLLAGLLLGLWQLAAWSRAREMRPGDLVLAAELELERLWYRLAPPRIDPGAAPAVSAAELERRLRLGADWLLAMQEPGGRFRYWFRPDRNTGSAPGDDNFLRQAGTAFSLLLVYQHTGEPRLLQAVDRALDHQLRHVKLLDDDKAYLLFDGKAKLGGIALPMLTLLKRRQLTGDPRHDALLRKLAAMILHLQGLTGTGAFKSTYVYRGDYQYEQRSGWESNIYPGEAMYALAEMHRAFGDAAYREAVDRAMAYYSVADRWRNHAFLSWSISAMTSLYQQTGAVSYAEFGLRMADFLLSQQNLDVGDEVAGSFHAFPAANSATYLEGLGDAVRLASLHHDEIRRGRYIDHDRLGLGFLLRLQIDDREAQSFANPRLASGGVRQSLSVPMLRIDNTQHSLGALVRALWYVHQQPAARPTHD